MGARLLVGDVFDRLVHVEDGSVDLVLSSPPFLALRKYLPDDHPDKAREVGSEATPAAFIDALLDVVEALTPKLAAHGSLVFELGDSYSGSQGAGGTFEGDGPASGPRTAEESRLGVDARNRGRRGGNAQWSRRGDEWPLPKSLCLIPESFRWALVYGRNPFNGRETPRWRARNVVRWCRPNPSVGSLGDKFRPATSEMVVVCKSARRYFDLDAVRDPNSRMDLGSVGSGRAYGMPGAGGDSGNEDKPIVPNPAGAPPLDWWETDVLPGFDPPPLPLPRPAADPKVGVQDRSIPELLNNGGHMGTHPGGPPPLDWWSIATEPYAGSHYATFSRKLLDRPILAMCPQRVCRVCGEPSRRIVEPSDEYAAFRAARRGDAELPPSDWQRDARDNRVTPGGASRMTSDRAELVSADYQTVGWSDCGHNNWRPGLVLDPFAGSGTTLQVAIAHGRDAIGIDIDDRNVPLAVERCGLFLTVER